jgi:hypothetical protein
MKVGIRLRSRVPLGASSGSPSIESAVSNGSALRTVGKAGGRTAPALAFVVVSASAPGVWLMTVAVFGCPWSRYASRGNSRVEVGDALKGVFA